MVNPLPAEFVKNWLSRGQNYGQKLVLFYFCNTGIRLVFFGGNKFQNLGLNTHSADWPLIRVLNYILYLEVNACIRPPPRALE